MKIKTTQAGSSTEKITDEEKKKAQEASASSIEVPITNVDKKNLSELRPEELKKVSLNAKICAITEAKDIGTIPLQELIGSLKDEEEVINYKKTRRKNKKFLALAIAKAEKLLEVNDSEEDGDDELVMFAKNFKKLLKNKSNRGEYPQRSRHDNYEKRSRPKEYGSYKNEQLKCFECNKPGYIKGDCPRLKKKSQPKKAMKSTWDDDVTG
ncbi:hypothetical protein LIER_31952 [Lithospermum erythrorhizon]|uniref:CCHC-type domain-containing protein n=1 Tax=Lithospermum erythrorhizon TaxID=34254 RepID=A0AAV3RUQ5_LITER